MKKLRGIQATVGAAAVMVLVAACGGGGGSTTSGGSGDSGASGDVTLEFQQWWEPELPDGSLRELMDEFEEENPGITVELLSGPFASTREQVVAGAASGTMADVVGLDGAWVNDFANQGAIADLSTIMSDAGYDDSQLASQIQVNGATYMIPVVNFVYLLFANNDLLSQAGISEVPTDRTSFMEAAQAVTDLGSASGWALPLNLESPVGVQNDVMSWVWASGGTMLTEDGQPDLTNDDVTSAVDFVQQLWDAGVVAPGALTMREQDKVEEFTNGRLGMMVDTLAHINLIRENAPDLDFSVAAMPAEDDYSGERGVTYASWGIGISANSDHPEEAWKLVEFLLSVDVNSQLSTLANAFPGNTESQPDLSSADPLFQEAFDIWNAGYPANEFTGLPVADQLMRTFDEQLQSLLNGDQTVEQALQNAQDEWVSEF